MRGEIKEGRGQGRIGTNRSRSSAGTSSSRWGRSAAVGTVAVGPAGRGGLGTFARRTGIARGCGGGGR